MNTEQQEPKPPAEPPEPVSEPEPEAEVIWIRRDEVYPELCNPKTMSFELSETANANHCNSQVVSKDTYKDRDRRPRKLGNARKSHSGKPKRAQRVLSRNANNANNSRNDLYMRKLIVAEWQRIAAVIDRLLFWIYVLGTIVSYIIILFVIPKQNYDKWNAGIVHIPPVRSDSRFTM